MYKAMLSYAQMKADLMFLTGKNLFRYDEDTQKFKNTKKGLRFFDTCNRIGEMMKDDNNYNNKCGYRGKKKSDRVAYLANAFLASYI